MPTVKRTILSASVVLLLAAGLTGCAAISSGGSLIPDVTSAAASATPKTGDVVDAAQAKVILKAGKGQHAYPMADGTFVVVTKTEPLPADVQADADAVATKTNAPFQNINESNIEAGNDAFYKSLDDVIAATGKRVILIVPCYGYTESAVDTEDDGFNNMESKSDYWIIGGGPGEGTAFMSMDDVNSTIAAWLAEQPNANEFAVVTAS